MDLDFESYIRGSEPDKKEKASAWKTAIGLQAVDGLQTSDYLKDTARKHLEGDISIDEVKKLIYGYYQSKTARTTDDLFADNSWYFRNALVRANYRNVRKGIEPDMTFLISFFRNLMMGEKNELKNKYMVIDAPQECISKQDPTSSRQAPDKLPASSPAILNLIKTLGKQQLSIKEMLIAMNLKDRENFMENYLSPAIKDGFIVMLYPDNPKHPRQKYLLTTKGLAIYNSKS